QRAEVHTRGRHHDQRACRRKGCCRAGGARYRDRYCASGPRKDFRRLPAAGQLSHACVQRHRAGAVDLPAALPDAGRPDHGRERAREGIDVYRHPAEPATEMKNQMANKNEKPRVLVVDDYPDAREMYTEYLDYCGFEVVEAANGMEALQRAIDTQPDIILM